jgi:Ser/Thr protein kinase RdoA (MazF antagonist)
VSLLPPASVLAAYGFTAEAVVVPVEGGLINHTFRVEEGERRVALQRLHTIFAPTVNLDIEAITRHLAERGLLTPRVVPTVEGALWCTDESGGHWRVLSWLTGRTLHAVEHPHTAQAAGQLVARFHGAVADLAHTFHFTRPLAHDTPAHLARLTAALAEHTSHARYAVVSELGEAILRDAEALGPLPPVPSRLIHGDLKISNILFDAEAQRALALLDLDTMANLTIPIELGDALRSWCNPAGEEAARATFRADIFEAAIAGYAEGAHTWLTPAEASSLVLGAQTIALELAARFCTDALEESYFGWNASKYASRSEHNRVRAHSQLTVARSVAAQRDALEALVLRHFTRP